MHGAVSSTLFKIRRLEQAEGYMKVAARKKRITHWFSLKLSQEQPGITAAGAGKRAGRAEREREKERVKSTLCAPFALSLCI